MAAGGEEEEGAITDPSADVTEETDEKLKVSSCCLFKYK